MNTKMLASWKFREKKYVSEIKMTNFCEKDERELRDMEYGCAGCIGCTDAFLGLFGKLVANRQPTSQLPRPYRLTFQLAVATDDLSQWEIPSSRLSWGNVFCEPEHVV